MSRSHRDPLVLAVHRVRSADEVERLVAAGVDEVGFHVDDEVVFGIDADPLFDDDRYVLLADVAELTAPLGGARGIVQLGRELWSDELPAQLAAEGVSAIHVPVREPLDDAVAAACAAAGLTLIAADLPLDPEDGPFLDAIVRPHLAASQLEVQLFPSYDDGWTFLRDVSPNFVGDSVTFDQLEGLARQVPLLLSLNVTVDNCTEICDRLADSAVRGLTFTLSTAFVGPMRTFDIDAVVDVVTAIRGR